MDAQVLNREFATIQFRRVLAALQREPDGSLPDLEPIRNGQFSPKDREAIFAALVDCSKRHSACSYWRQALVLLSLARIFGTKSSILDKRIALLREVPDRASVGWTIGLQDMQRQFGTICRKDRCSCTSHYDMAACLGVFGTDNPHSLAWANCDIHTVGWYHSFTLKPLWSDIIKRIKRDFCREFLPFVGRIMADYIIQKTSYLRSVDFLVPVPPSTAKYGQRGFAPTDEIAAEVSRLTCVPAISILNRRPGTPTREASDQELDQQFWVKRGAERICDGASVLLIEDVVTTGRTVSICSGKLISAGARTVSAVALAKATRI